MSRPYEIVKWDNKDNNMSHTYMKHGFHSFCNICLVVLTDQSNKLCILHMQFKVCIYTGS